MYQLDMTIMPHPIIFLIAGDKGRFQLFGDTVNMAAKMESTGVRHIRFDYLLFC